MKAQVFSLDALIALVLVIVILSIVVERTTEARSVDVHYLELKQLADDFSQIAVKRSLTNGEPNVISSSKLQEFSSKMSSLSYDYEIELSTGEKIGDCSGHDEVAVSKRAVVIDGVSGWLEVKICS